MRYALFTLVFCSFQLSAQQAIQWQKCLGSSGIEEAYDIQSTSDMGCIIAGFAFSNNDGDVTDSKQGGDAWLVKLDISGDIEWSKSLGGTGSDAAYSIKQTTDGGYIMAGSTSSDNGDVVGLHGEWDYWIVKLDSSGEIQWKKVLGGSKTEIAKSIIQCADSGYLIAGYSTSNDGDVSGNHGHEDFWIVKLGTNGAIEWQKSFGGSSEDIANTVQKTSDGGFIVVGNSLSTDGDVSNSNGDNDFWVLKLDHNGNLQWQKAYGGTAIESGYSVVQTFDGGYIITGLTSSTNSGQVSGGHGNFDAWVIKIDSGGSLEWQRALGGSGPDYGRSIIQISDSTYVLAGSAGSTNGDIIDNDGGVDFWLINLDKSGQILWQKTLGGSKAEIGWAVTAGGDKSLVVTGYAWSIDGEVTGVHGYSDYWVVKLSPTNTPTLTPTLTQLTLYPNPTSQQITLQTPDKEPITSIQITDLSGKTLKTEQAPQDKTLQVAMLPKGMYLLKATSDSGKVFCGRFIKE